ncbi:hypothetical protein DMH18_25980 [Streptomyces sp. WAC 06783]|nr:hypothetical protein DMH18_25980 [Streptomyces sp. WAC 06783]
MSTSVLRWLLSPRTSWLAWRLAQASRGSISFDAAWRRIRVRLHPDEAPFRRQGHYPGSVGRRPDTEA